MFGFQELAEIAQQDNKKLEELKHTQTELERLLQEETQAKRDEEIVRALQARLISNKLLRLNRSRLPHVLNRITY